MIFSREKSAIAICIFFMAQAAWASATNVSATQVAQDAEPSPKIQSFHLLVLNEVGSDLISPSDPYHSAEWDFLIGPSYKISPDWSILASFPFKQELTGYQRVLFQDAKVALAHSALKVNSYMNFLTAAAIRIPLSDESRNVDTETVGAQLGAELDNDLAGIGLKNVSLNYQILSGRDFYQYTTSASGRGNIEYDLSQRVDLGYQITDRISVTGTGRYFSGLDYFQNITNRFEFDEELDYQVAKNWQAGVGHSNSADVLQPDGHSSNFDIYNPYTSVVYGVLSFTY